MSLSIKSLFQNCYITYVVSYYLFEKKYVYLENLNFNVKIMKVKTTYISKNL